MSQNLPVIRNDFEAVCGMEGAKRVRVSKSAIHPVRNATPGEVALNKEIAKDNDIAIMPRDTKNATAEALYFMSSQKLLSTSEHKYTDDELAYWSIECKPVDAVIVPLSQGPFHLEAPRGWLNHQGWDVREASGFDTPILFQMAGFLIIKSKDGIFYDKPNRKDGRFRVIDYNLD
tara:strand:- start:419 stop:943 length:525 start_codon:yes stop_codon:yes gene_type:complete